MGLNSTWHHCKYLNCARFELVWHNGTNWTDAWSENPPLTWHSRQAEANASSISKVSNSMWTQVCCREETSLRPEMKIELWHEAREPGRNKTTWPLSLTRLLEEEERGRKRRGGGRTSEVRGLTLLNSSGVLEAGEMSLIGARFTWFHRGCTDSTLIISSSWEPTCVMSNIHCNSVFSQAIGALSPVAEEQFTYYVLLVVMRANYVSTSLFSYHEILLTLDSNKTGKAIDSFSCNNLWVFAPVYHL